MTGRYKRSNLLQNNINYGSKNVLLRKPHYWCFYKCFKTQLNSKTNTLSHLVPIKTHISKTWSQTSKRKIVKMLQPKTHVSTQPKNSFCVYRLSKPYLWKTHLAFKMKSGQTKIRNSSRSAASDRKPFDLLTFG